MVATDSLLDFSYDDPPTPEDFLQAAMRWHFDPATGSEFWLSRRARLGFDPIRDIKTFDDLEQFPDVAAELRGLDVRQLIPRGYGPNPDVAAIFESGGTTGAPKRIAFLQDWLDRLLAWNVYDMRKRGWDWTGLNALAAIPGRPHMIGGFTDHLLARVGGIKFAIDMDPRWVKHLIRGGDEDAAAAYGEHLVAQAEDVLRTQDVSLLLASPPMLHRLATRDDLVDLVRDKIRYIVWGGTHMDADTRRLYRTEIFPGIPMLGAYGSTTFAGSCHERIGTAPDEPGAFDGLHLNVTFGVVDSGTGHKVPYGQRGSVVVNHVSRGMFLPNVHERDLAVRVPVVEGFVGDALADVTPADTFDGHEVIEGVY